MYVVFPISVRTQLELEKRYAARGGMDAVRVRLRLPDGTLHRPARQDRLCRAERAAEHRHHPAAGRIPNPARKPVQPGVPVDRTLIDGEFVSVLVEGIEPVEALAIPALPCWQTNAVTMCTSSMRTTGSSNAASGLDNRRRPPR